MGVGPDRRDGGPAPPAGGFSGEKVGRVRARRRAGRIAAVRTCVTIRFPPADRDGFVHPVVGRLFLLICAVVFIGIV